MTGNASNVPQLRCLLVLMLSLLWFTMGSAAALAERGDIGPSSFAAKSEGPFVDPGLPKAKIRLLARWQELLGDSEISHVTGKKQRQAA